MASLRGTRTHLEAAQDLGDTEFSFGWFVFLSMLILLAVVYVKKTIDEKLAALSKTPFGDFYRVVKHLSLFVYNALSLLVRPLIWFSERITPTDIHYDPLTSIDTH